MIKVGFIGWRGMVGSVLMQRMLEDNDYKGYEPLFFSTSQAGEKGPNIGRDIPVLADAMNIDELSKMDIIVTTQGGAYTKEIHPVLRKSGWKGYWIDAASTLRMENDSIIILDPVNIGVIENGLANGIKDYIGGNCTVSLMLMALGGLFEKDMVEWLTSMTYQAASGSGAKNMRELVKQMQIIGNASPDLDNLSSAILELDKTITTTVKDSSFPIDNFGAPLAGSLIPWIDAPMENGQTKEEWKGISETNKILGRKNNIIPIDGQCVRVGAMRCHSQAFTIKLKNNVSLKEIEEIISSNNKWVKLIPNEKDATLKELSPAFVNGTLRVPIGRLRKMNLGSNYLTAFSVGDQLLWGAAEPVKRMLKIALEYIS